MELTQDRLARKRREVEHLAFVVPNAAVTSKLLEQQTEIEQLTAALTETQHAQDRYRFYALDGIRDDMCPACGGRVVLDESDPQRIRIRSTNYQRAS